MYLSFKCCYGTCLHYLCQQIFPHTYHPLSENVTPEPKIRFEMAIPCVGWLLNTTQHHAISPIIRLLNPDIDWSICQFPFIGMLTHKTERICSLTISCHDWGLISFILGSRSRDVELYSISNIEYFLCINAPGFSDLCIRIPKYLCSPLCLFHHHLDQILCNVFFGRSNGLY